MGTKLPQRVPGQIRPQKWSFEYWIPIEIDQEQGICKNAGCFCKWGGAVGGQDTD